MVRKKCASQIIPAIRYYSSYAVNLASMQSGIKELQWLEYFKVAFLEIRNIGFPQIRSHIVLDTLTSIMDSYYRHINYYPCGNFYLVNILFSTRKVIHTYVSWNCNIYPLCCKVVNTLYHFIKFVLN